MSKICLPLFIFSFILRISKVPSGVLFPSLLIISATFTQSAKSLDFAPLIGYFKKKFLIFSQLSVKFVHWKYPHSLLLGTV